jgi:uncharacterized membrane protein
VRKSIWEDSKLRGVDFRAIGNEPGWYLELTKEDHILFVYDNGQQKVIMPEPKLEVHADDQTAIYQSKTEAPEMTVTILGEPCEDTMSGELFESTVMVVLDGQSFHGCGRALH